LALFAAAALAVAVSACGVSIAEDGPHEVRSRDVASFNRIEVRGSTEVTVAHGPHAVLRLEGGANRVHDLHTWVEDGTLVVEQQDTSGTLDLGGDPARVVAQVPRIEAVRIDGSGTLHLAALRADRAAVAIFGSGSADIGSTGRLDAEIDGSASIFYAGDPVLSEDISGSGRIEPSGT
jgi:hypothetical protein